MEKIVETMSVKEKSIFYFQNGYHCAEAVAAAVLEDMGDDPAMAVAHATAFGGGMGRSFCETCGALSGALIVVGQYNAREIRGASWDEAAALGARIRELFVDQYGTTHCGTLRERFGEDQSELCARLTGTIAADLAGFLQG